MPVGKVKWFNNAKGFGFIISDSGGEDLFAHYSTIEMDGYRTLKAGQTVSFEISQGEKGLHATQIKVVNAEVGESAVAAAPRAQAPRSPSRSPADAVAEEA